MLFSKSILFSLLTSLVASHSHKEPVVDGPTLQQLWGDDWPFSGINTFAHLPHTKCLVDPSQEYDIAIVGVPFDTAVSYRSGARFGPRAIRAAAQRQTPNRAYSVRSEINPYNNWAKIMDCGDIPVTPMDNKLALLQMTKGYENILAHNTSSGVWKAPKIVSLGGDHSIIYPALKALNQIHGPISLIHFDAHLDTWLPDKYPSHWDSESGHFTHGTMLYLAYEDGLLSKDTNMHVGLRTRLSDASDYEDDDVQGFQRIHADDILEIGVDGIITKILKRIPKDQPVYISVDIDVIDPGLAPGTGTPEVGGFLTRELLKIIHNLQDLNVVGVDIVEVSPAFDHAEITALAGAQLAYEFITNMVKKEANNTTAGIPSIDIASGFPGKLLNQE
ncbi:hypothetical protein WICPIJ_003022 [Wickerhamomyces pijperi]|uniref:Agmatinase n=1 Tax=Wickerhamomyces pijperi TaxID=599730 RepID=A0A9P8QAJ9_WICPI|nr:hypothetical protein WICPIJ_003022 [Wickerhamomyces pijperi]